MKWCATLVLALLSLSFTSADAQTLLFGTPKPLHHIGSAAITAVADVDDDLVFSTVIDNRLYIAQNNAGTYEVMIAIPGLPAGTQAHGVLALAVADMNADNKKDIIIAESDGTDRTKRLTTYTFTTDHLQKISSFDLPAEGFILQLATATLNDDTKHDMIALVQTPTGKQVWEFVSTTTAYARNTISTQPISPEKFAVGDLNNDGRPDLLVRGTSFQLGIFMRNEQGTFTHSQSLAASGSNILDFDVADFNGDNLPDILVEPYASPFDLFVQAPAGTYTKQAITFQGDAFLNFAIGDVDEDNDKDIVYTGTVTDPITRAGFSVLKNNGTGTFTQSFTPSPLQALTDVVLADRDGDGTLEVFPIGPGALIAGFEDVGGSYENTIHVPYGLNYLHRGVIDDVNGDGKEDLIVANGTQAVSISYHTGGEKIYGDPVFFKTVLQPSSVATGDFNSDGIKDIVYGTYQYGGVSGGGIILSDESGRPADHTVLNSMTSGVGLASGDFNNDGKDDFFNANNIHFGKGDGTFDYYFVSNSPSSLTSVQSGDINADGYDDLVMGTHLGISISYGKGALAMDAGPNVIVSITPVEIRLIDLDNDGKKDIIFTDLNVKKLLILKQSAGGNFTEESITTQYPVRAITVVDIENDGDQDVAFYSYENLNHFMTYYGNTSGVLTLLASKTLNSQYSYDNLHSARLNNDTYRDLILFHNQAPVIVMYNDRVEAPTIGSTAPVISERTHNSARLTVTPGDGNARMIILRKITEPTEVPVEDVAYSAGQLLGESRVVSFANSHSVAITELDPNSVYFFKVIELNHNEPKSMIRYLSSPVLTGSFVTKDVQTISFSIPTKVETDPDFALTATTTSGLPIVYERVSGEIVLTGNMVAINGPGPASIKAKQAGSDDFSEANMTVEFCVNPTKPTIAVSLQDAKYLLTSSSATNNTWYRNGELVVGQTSATLVPDLDGQYTVKVVYGTCTSTSDATAHLFVGVSEVGTILQLYPNPASHVVYVDVPSSSSERSPVVVTDVLGRAAEVATQWDNNTAQLNVSGLMPGLYVVRIADVKLKFTKR